MNFDAHHLEERIVYVVEHGGIVSGFTSARLVWQVEPLCIFDEFRRNAPPMTLRRSVFYLARAITHYILRSPENKTGIRWLFAYIESKRFQKLAREFGMLSVYRRGKLFFMEQ